jgi:hypothetical protein
MRKTDRQNHHHSTSNGQGHPRAHVPAKMHQNALKALDQEGHGSVQKAFGA